MPNIASHARPRPRHRRRSAALVLSVGATVIVAFVHFHGNDVAVAAPGRPAATRPAPGATGTTSVHYTFDGGLRDLNRGAGGAPKLIESTAAGGTIAVTTHHGGDAIDFPPSCARSPASCGRAILETSGDVSALNPGTRAISYGATVRLGRAQTSDGENVVQKGFATGGSEYKLQVDGDAGRPSCAVVGTTRSTIYLARSSVSVADGRWHELTCDLHSQKLTISIDGVIRGDRAVPKNTTISNRDPVRIGGKGTSVNNDQFNGALDDVWITISP